MYSGLLRKIKMRLKLKTALIIAIFLTGIPGLNLAQQQSQEEQLAITTYYPSPAGSYRSVEAQGRAYIDNFNLAAASRLMRRTPDGTEYELMNDAGFVLRNNEKFLFQNSYFTRDLKARHLKVTNNPNDPNNFWRPLTWRRTPGVGGSLSALSPFNIGGAEGDTFIDFGMALAGTSSNSTMSCGQDGILHNLVMLIKVNPTCFCIIGEGLCLCFGKTLPLTYYECFKLHN